MSALLFLGAATHEMQKERGVTAIWVASNYLLATELVDSQRISTDKCWVGNGGILTGGLVPHEHIVAHRARLDDRRVKQHYLEAVEFYTEAMTILLRQAGSIVGTLKGQMGMKEQQSNGASGGGGGGSARSIHETTSIFSAYVCFLKLKESIGQERALIGGALAAYREPVHPKTVELVSQGVSRQTSIGSALRELIPAHLGPTFESFVVLSPECEHVRRVIALGESVVGMMTPLEWFRACTSRMNKMHLIEDALGSMISSAVAVEEMPQSSLHEYSGNQLSLQQLLDQGRRGRWLIHQKEIMPSMSEKPFAVGSMGSVYKAVWRHTVVAVKTLHRMSAKGLIGASSSEHRHRSYSTEYGVNGDDGGDAILTGGVSSGAEDSAQEDFSVALMDLAKEVELLASLRHPKVVLFLGASYSPRLGLMCVLEFMDGGTLEMVMNYTDSTADTNPSNGLDRRRRLSRKEKASVAVQVAQGLCFLHGAVPPLIHRDLKPSNIFVDAHLNTKIGDFGLAKYVTDSCSAYTMTGVTGTLRYMAREVLLGESYNVQVDTYSFGVLMMSLLSSRQVWTGADVEDVITVAKKATHVMEHPSNVPLVETGGAHWTGIGHIRDMFMQCCSPDPEDRPPLSEVLECLQGPIEVQASGAAPTRYPVPKKDGRLISNADDDDWDRGGGGGGSRGGSGAIAAGADGSKEDGGGAGGDLAANGKASSQRTEGRSTSGRCTCDIM